MKVKDLPDEQIIVLCGSQASGKSTAKRYLAQVLGYPGIERRPLIERRVLPLYRAEFPEIRDLYRRDVFSKATDWYRKLGGIEQLFLDEKLPEDTAHVVIDNLRCLPEVEGFGKPGAVFIGLYADHDVRIKRTLQRGEKDYDAIPGKTPEESAQALLDLQDQLFPQPAMMEYLKKHDKLVIDTSTLAPGDLAEKIWAHLQEKKVLPADYNGSVVPY